MQYVVPAIAYFILTMQLSFGFPPFYRSCKVFFLRIDLIEKDEIIEFVHHSFLGIFGCGVSAALVEWTGYEAFFLIGAAAFCWSGWSIRSQLKMKTDGPLLWVIPHSFFPLIYPWLTRWPMLVFDLWTIGISGIFGLTMVLSTLP